LGPIPWDKATAEQTNARGQRSGLCCAQACSAQVTQPDLSHHHDEGDYESGDAFYLCRSGSAVTRFRPGQGRCWITAEIGFQELWCFWQHELQVAFPVQLQAELVVL
jgi:hypothetical protein